MAAPAQKKPIQTAQDNLTGYQATLAQSKLVLERV
jgi:hypothetical protein